MIRTTSVVLFAALISQISTAPQLISFKDGKIGVNFGGYHAGVGFGGLLGGGGAGGLYAEAGTPHGQSAIAGLGGSVSEHGGQSGGLFAGATAGNGIKASAGLAGGVNSEHSAGAGYASAQAGNNYAATGMGGATSIDGSTGYSFSSTKDVIAPVHKKVHTEINVDSINEVSPLPVATNVQTITKTENVQPVLVKEVSNIWRPNGEIMRHVKLNDFQGVVDSLFNAAFTAGYNQRLRRRPQHNYFFSEVYVAPKTRVIEKEIVHTHYKPRASHRHHFRKTAFLGGYIGGEGDISGPPVVYKTVQPQIQKRVDIDTEASSNVGAAVEGNINGGIGSSHTYTKQVTVQKNPTFFADIFNIPISTLKAVGDFLGNTASNTHVSVQKSASVQAETDSISPKHALSSESSSSTAHISVETPAVSKVIDDIFAIPINTLGAVNKFLQNNIAGRKTVQVSEDGVVENSRVRLGPGRRRANKRVVLVQEEKPVEYGTEH